MLNNCILQGNMGKLVKQLSKHDSPGMMTDISH